MSLDGAIKREMADYGDPELKRSHVFNLIIITQTMAILKFKPFLCHMTFPIF